MASEPKQAEDKNPCAICLEEINEAKQPTMVLPCSHKFHIGCGLKLKLDGKILECPLCRRTYDIDDVIPGDKSAILLTLMGFLAALPDKKKSTSEKKQPDMIHHAESLERKQEGVANPLLSQPLHCFYTPPLNSDYVINQSTSRFYDEAEKKAMNKAGYDMVMKTPLSPYQDRQIFIRTTIDDEVRLVNFDKRDLIGHLMIWVETNLRVPFTHQDVYFCDQYLNPCNTFEHYNIQNENTLEIITRFPYLAVSKKNFPPIAYNHSQCKEVSDQEYVASIPVSKNPDWEISIMTLAGRMTTIRMSGQDLVGHLKIKYEKDQGVPFDQQKLLFAGHYLDSRKTLAECGIQNGTTLHMILNLRGGKPVVCISGPLDADIQVTLSATNPDNMQLILPYPAIKHDYKTMTWDLKYRTKPFDNFFPVPTIGRPRTYPYIFYEFLNLHEGQDALRLKASNTLWLEKPTYTALSNVLDHIANQHGLDEKNAADFVTWWLPQMKPNDNMDDNLASFAIAIIEDKDYEKLVHADVTVKLKNAVNTAGPVIKYSSSEPVCTKEPEIVEAFSSKTNYMEPVINKIQVHRFFMLWAKYIPMYGVTTKEIENFGKACLQNTMMAAESRPLWNQRSGEMFCVVEWGGMQVPVYNMNI